MLRNRQDSLETAEEWVNTRGPVRDSYNIIVLDQGVVKLEAPEELSKKAEEVRKHVQSQLEAVERFTTPGIEDPVREKECEEFLAAGKRAFSALDAFTITARANVDD